MTYYESAEGEVITLERALHELDKHGCVDADKTDFLRDLGREDYYDAQAVLRWLGY